MDDLEGRLRAEGALDSRGSFTLDSVQALAKMSQYALPDARRYVLNLVSWAVAAGATQMDFAISPGRLEFSHDGQAPHPDELRDLFANFLGHGLALQELAIAARAAVFLPGSRVSLSSSQGVLSFDQAKLDFKAHKQRQDVRFLWHQAGQLKQWFHRALGRTTEEENWLAALARHAEVAIRVNGRPVNVPIELPDWRAGVLIGATSPVFQFLELGNFTRCEANGDFSAFVSLGRVPVLPTPSLFLVRGLSFEMPPLTTDGEPWSVVVHANSLKKDLSQSRLVVDPQLQTIHDQLQSVSRHSIFTVE